eukprot:CAMPEP_0201947032 /NCGR_PEP_ID=MMETSP0903-20130614/54725_1 /ASSEMBLY_ACC=CAM_ASM_000552 /TAXON_ID=420261 /ORGANISM="Thalassiosira antarctica, Strain CCMP982" /LENGTH=1813 /DNA_ID=CAMNT_0048490153 /DNA_START=42 /DNA_END=5484 /DNA_ORIENTATION=+
MSLVASAHRARMKKKRANVTTSPTNGKSIVSPRNSAGKGNGGIVASNRQPLVSPRIAAGKDASNKQPSSSSSRYDAISPTNASPVIATLNGVKSQYHVPSDSPSMKMQQQSHVPANGPPVQNVPQQRHPPAYHPPRPSIHGHGRGGSYGGGINSLDTSGDYMVDNHTQWQQQQHQQQQQHRGVSPSPSPVYNPNRQTLHQPSPQRQHSPLNHPPQSPGTFDAATRYQGNYTNYLSPRKPHRVPNRPRRRYDSFEGAPEDVDEMEMHHQQQQQLHHQQQHAQMQQQQAFDPFGPSPLTLPNNGGLVGNAGDVHSAHRSSPLFQGAFPRQQLNNGINSSMNSSMNNMYANDNNNGMYANDPNNNAHQDIDNPMLATIKGNQLGDFVYDPETELEDYQDSQEENYQDSQDENYTEEEEIATVNEHQFSGVTEKDIAAFVGSSTAVAYPIHNPAEVQPSYRAQPPPLMHDYDCEYHTEKDESSMYYGGEEMYNGEGGDVIMPLPPGIMEEEDGLEEGDMSLGNYSNNAVGRPRNRSGRVVGEVDPPEMAMDSSFENETIADQTMDSERALYGTPVIRKKDKSKKKRRGHGRSRIIIDNVNKAREHSKEKTSSGRDPRYAIHYIEEDDNSMIEEPEEENDGHQHIQQNIHHDRIASRARRDIVAHARRIASGSDSNSQVSDEPQPSREHGRLPPEMPMSNRDDQADANNVSLVGDSDTRFFSPPRNTGVSKSWVKQDVLSNAKQAGPSFGSFSRNLMWDHDNGDDGNVDNDNDDQDSGAHQQQRQQGNNKVTMRASKSWEEETNISEIVYPAVDDSIATWGTWGDQTTSLLDGTAGSGGGGSTAGGSAFGGRGGGGPGGGGDNQDPFGSDKENLFQQQENLFQQDDEMDARALAEWDRAEAEWREKSVVEDVSFTVEEEQGGLPSSFLDISNDADEQQQMTMMQQPPPPLVARPKLAPKKPPPLVSPPKTKKKSHGHPWKSSSPPTKNNKLREDEPSNGVGIDVFHESSSAFSEPAVLRNNKESSPIRFSKNVIGPSEDDDSIFEFGKRGIGRSASSSIFEFDKSGGGSSSQLGVGAAAADGVGLAVSAATRSSSPSNPVDIFSKINNSLEEVDKTKNRALGIESDGSNDRSEIVDDEQRLKEEALLLKLARESPASLMSKGSILSTGTAVKKKNSGRRIAFAEGAPQVHTYLLSNPADIFIKINKSLEEAGKTKNRSLGIESDGSNDRSEVEDEEQRLKEEALLLKLARESPASLMSKGSILSTGTAVKKKNSGRRIAFAEGAPQVHTYLAAEESSVESEYTYDDTKDEEEDNRFDTTDEDGMMEVIGTKSTPSVSLFEKLTGVSDEARSQQMQPQNQQQKQVRRMSTENDSLIHEGSDADTYGDSTLGDSTYNAPTKEEEPVGGGDNWVDNAVTMVTASLGGLFGAAALAASAAAAPSQATEDKNGGTTDRGGGGGDRGSPRSLVTEEEEKSIETDGDNDTYGDSTMQSTQYTGTQYTGRTDGGSEGDWLGYMRNIIFPKDDGASIISGQTLGTKYSQYSGTYDADDSTYQDDEDNYLLQQALAAARAIHHVQGVEYDETQDINVSTDIKFVVATVSLPLGLLFQEHEIGVWVSRVVPDGNGAKKGVQHGDQLAAINGNSSVHTTIDEVACTISGTPVDIGVELTFLRYVGPLRPVPGSIIQEGFEVTDTTILPKKKAAAAKSSKRSLFSKMKSGKVNGGDGGTPPSSPGMSTRRFASLDISPKSPKRIASSRSPKNTHSTQSSPKGLSASMASSSKQSSAPSQPVLPGGEQQQSNTRQSTKKKKSLGKLLPFKKK